MKLFVISIIIILLLAGCQKKSSAWWHCFYYEQNHDGKSLPVCSEFHWCGIGRCEKAD